MLDRNGWDFSPCSLGSENHPRRHSRLQKPQATASPGLRGLTRALRRRTDILGLGLDSGSAGVLGVGGSVPLCLLPVAVEKLANTFGGVQM